MSCNGCRVLRKGLQRCLRAQAQHRVDRRRAQPKKPTPPSSSQSSSDGRVSSPHSPVPLQHRPALFRSLLYEACGRTINPVSGSIGLMWTGNWGFARPRAAEAVLRALSATPATFTDRDMAGLYGNVSLAAASSPEHCSFTPSNKSRNNGHFFAAKDDFQPPAGLLQSCELPLCMTPASPQAGARQRCGGVGGGASDEYSATTTCDEEGGDVEAGAPTLLNLFN